MADSLLHNPPNHGAQNQTRTFIAVAGALFANVVIDSVYSVLAKDALGNNSLNPLVFSFYRDLSALPILLVAASLLDGFRRPELRDVPILCLLGLLLGLTAV